MEEEIQQECQMFKHFEKNEKEKYRINIVPDLGIIPVILPILEGDIHYCSLCSFMHYHFPYYTWNDLEKSRRAKNVKRFTIQGKNMLQFRIKDYCENMKLFVSERHLRFPISELIQQMILFQQQFKTTIFTTLKTRINHGGYMYESLDLSCPNYHFHVVSTTEKPMLFNEIIERDEEKFIKINTRNYSAIAFSRSPSMMEMSEIESLVKCSNLVGITVFSHPTNKNTQYMVICGSVRSQQYIIDINTFFLCALQTFMIPKKVRITELVGKIKHFTKPDPKISYLPQERSITFYYNIQASQFKYFHSVPQCYAFLKVIPYANEYMLKLIRSFCATDCKNGIPFVLGNQKIWSRRKAAPSSFSSVHFLNSTDLGIVKIVPLAKRDSNSSQSTLGIMRIYDECLNKLIHFAQIYMRCRERKTINTLYMEKGDIVFNDLESRMFYHRNANENIQKVEYEYSALLFQVLISLQIAWDRCEFNHNDLHASNILVTDTTIPVLYTYEYNGDMFKISSRYCVKIIDFDRAACKSVPPRILCPAFMWTRKTTSFRDIFTFLMGEIAHRPLMLFPNLKSVFELFLRTNGILFDNVERYIAEYTNKCKNLNTGYKEFEKLFVLNMKNRTKIAKLQNTSSETLYHRLVYNFRFNPNDDIDKIPNSDIYDSIEDKQRVTPIFWANEIYVNAIQPFHPTHPNVFQIGTVVDRLRTSECLTTWSYLCTDDDVGMNKFITNVFSLWDAPRAPYCQELQRHGFYTSSVPE